MTHKKTSTAQMITCDSLSVVHPMNGGPNAQGAITIACIMDCPTITVHTGKCYKALTDFGTAISLLCYSTYQHIGDSFMTSIQPTTAKLNTANDSPMTALGMTALHLRIADFKFTHYFVICDRLPDTEIILAWTFRRSFHFYMLGTKKMTVMYKDMVYFTHTQRTVNRRPQLAQSNHHLKIPPRHNGLVLIKITGPVIEGHMAYFIINAN